MVQGLEKKLRSLERVQERTAAKIIKLKRRHARDLMNEARRLLGRSPITSRPKSERKARAARAERTAKKTNGGKAGGETK